jgi:putative transposase
MPARNIIKTYVANGIYHVYNRGVNKDIIFIDEQDYRVFSRILKTALSPPPDPKLIQIDITFKGGTFKGIPKQPKSFYEDIILIAYCLMPNHFHLLIQQVKEKSMNEFLRSVSVRYVMYFNKRHKRIGPLFQGTYKGSLVVDDTYLLHVSRYIHLNHLKNYQRPEHACSSYAEFIGIRHTEWIHPELVLQLLNTSDGIMRKKYETYKDFVESDEDSAELLGKDTLDY